MRARARLAAASARTRCRRRSRRCTPRRRRAAATDWDEIVGLYDVLLRLEPSPVVELNRAVAVAMRDGPAAGLALVDAILARGELAEYHLAHAARADLCRRLGRPAEARASYERALALTQPGARAAVPRAAAGGALSLIDEGVDWNEIRMPRVLEGSGNQRASRRASGTRSTTNAWHSAQRASGASNIWAARRSSRPTRRRRCACATAR